MNTQPSQEFLNEDQLADLAQAVVTDTHDVWPMIESEARRSMTKSTTGRASFLSKGRSAVWFVAGAVAIVVTLGIFALGIGALMLSPDQESEPVPAAQPDDAPSLTPRNTFATVVPTPARSASQTPVPTLPPRFEASLTGDNLTRYHTLPVEFQKALSEEAEASGVDTAVDLLSGLPESVPPLEDILSANGRGLLENADERLQRALLLEGYPDAVNHGGLLNARSAREYFEEMVMDATISSSRPWYPPIDETLTSEALAKLEAVDPVIERAFRLVWEFGWNPVPVPEPGWDSNPSTTQLGLALLVAPTTMPSIDDLGLPSENVELFENLPTLAQEWIWRTITADLTLGRDPAKSEHVTLNALTFYNQPSSRSAFEQGLMPRREDHPGAFSPLSCPTWPAAWPPGSVAIEPEDLPIRPVFLPPPGEVLSETALNNLRTMAPSLHEQFSIWWGITPYLPTGLNCTIARWDRDLSELPMLIPPSPDELLSAESLNTYNSFHPSQQRSFEFALAQFILTGVVSGEEPFGNVYYDGDLGAFMNALRDWAEWLVVKFAEQNKRNPPPGVTPPATKSWVSEDGFIQITTGEEPITEPLPGTHPWCVVPLSAPVTIPGPILVPSELPEGIVQTGRDELSTQNVAHMFQDGDKHITMMQMLCMTTQLKEGYYTEVPIGDRTAYVRQGAYQPAGGGTSAFDPDIELNLVMDVGYGAIMIYAFAPQQSGITADDLVLMANSLVPEELTEAETEPLQQEALDVPTVGESWVSEDGFIQFTTGKEPLTEPLPGTHPWCITPFSAPDKPGPYLVPSELPEGMVQTRRVVVTGRDVIRVFKRGGEQITMLQTLCVTAQLKKGRYNKVPIGERTAYVIQGAVGLRGGPSGSEPDGGVHLMMDIGYGVIMLDSFPPRRSGITAEDLLVQIARSLVPEELTEAEMEPLH